MQINDLYPILKEKYGLKYEDLDRIMRSQFEFMKICVENKTKKSIKLSGLGKVKPSSFLIANYEKFSKQS